jgi:VCBS repeat-containing protein
VTITIIGVNDAPTAHAASLNATEDGAMVTTGVLTDDIDSDDMAGTLLYTITSPPTEGTVISNGDGAFTFDPGTAFQDLAQGETRQVSFTYQATDSYGAIASETVTITVTGVNDAPTAQAASLNATEDGPMVTTAVLTDDIDSDDTAGTLLYSITSPPTEGTVISNGDGTFTFDPGTAFQELAQGETRQVSFTYEATDSYGGTASATVTVTVTGVNDAPVNTMPADQVALEDVAQVISGLAVADVDVGDTHTVTLAVAHGTLAINGSVSGGLTATNISGNGTATVTLSGTLAQINATLAAADGVTYLGVTDFSGLDTLTMTTTDTYGLSDTDSIAIDVLSAQQQAEVVTAMVTDLADTGILSTGEASSLTSKLPPASSTPTAAVHRLESFVKSVDAFVRTGKLTQAEGDELRRSAHAMIASLS